MKTILVVMFFAVLLVGCKSTARNQTNEFPMMPFRFIGTLQSISSNSYMNVHGEEWGMGITIERMLDGEYNNTNILWIGISNPTNPPLQRDRKYDIKAGWGRHGMEIIDLKEVK